MLMTDELILYFPSHLTLKTWKKISIIFRQDWRMINKRKVTNESIPKLTLAFNLSALSRVRNKERSPPKITS